MVSYTWSMSRTLALLIAGTLCATAPRTLAAQDASGMWFEVGVGPGWARVACDICDAGRATGISGHLALGGLVGQRTRLGAEVDAWSSDADGVPELMLSVSVVGHWRPAAARPLRLRAGVAYVTYRVDDNVDVVSASGFGPLVGAAFDWAVSDRVRLGPYATLVIGTIGGQMSFNGAPVQDAVNLNLLHVGVSATWR